MSNSDSNADDSRLGSTHNTPVLPVDDVDDAQLFYRDVLGFVIDWQAGDQFGAVSRGSVSLFFERTDLSIQPITCILSTTDADMAFRLFKRRGA